MTETTTTQTIEESYFARTRQSAELARRAQRVMPGGDTRSSAHHEPYPLTLSRGDGAKVWDVDGNEYWDIAGNYTSLVHGYNYPPIVEAADRAIRAGTVWPARNVHQVELAELLCDRLGSVDRVRFTNSGSEAAMLALAIARAVTGRPKILMARHGYHGSHESFEAGSLSGDSNIQGDAQTLTGTFGDAESFEEVLRQQSDQIAAVFLEGVMGGAGIVAGDSSFLGEVSDLAKKAGALFVLDEVVTFRLAWGGYQSLVGVAPDLTLFGKLIGGGFPVGAVGGRAELMDVTDPRRGSIHHAGTFNGNPVTSAAGVASVRELTGQRIDHMDHLGARLENGLMKAADEAGLPFSVRRVGSLLNIYLSGAPPAFSPARTDEEAISAFHLAALNRGLFMPSRGFMVLSTVMDDAAIDEILERCRMAMADVVE